MINYFNYNLAGPTDNGPVAIHTELSSAPWNTKHRLLRIGLKAKTIPTEKLAGIKPGIFDRCIGLYERG
jgi:Ca-activated chloride channel family protein